LAGDCSGRITLIDCNNFELQHFALADCEIEKVTWNPHSPTAFVASTDKGAIYTFDLRSPGPVSQTDAHSDSVTDLAFSSKCPNLLVSAGADQKIKVWDTAKNRLQLVHEYEQANVGKIYALSANPDLPYVFAVGGDNRLKNLEIMDISNIENS
jgi:WD40 repeat protein